MARNKEHKFHKRLRFFGRAGVKEFETLNGLRVAFVSGKDTDIFGQQIACKIDADKNYFGNYFSQQDIKNLISENDQKPVDILISCQYPAGLLPLDKKEDQAEIMNHTSSSLSVLAHRLSPRYIFASSSVEISEVGDPYLSSSKQFLSRATILANFGRKPEGSKETYIKAIEIEPMKSMVDFKGLREEIEQTDHIDQHIFETIFTDDHEQDFVNA